MSDEMFLSSLRNRVRAMNTLWERAASDLTLDQINHHERGGVLPLVFSFVHFQKIQDGAISGTFRREASLWGQGGWAKRVGASIDKGGREESVEEMEQLRILDLDAFREYQSAVIARTADTLATVSVEELSEVVIAAPLPEGMRNIYCAIVVDGGPLRKLEVVECFVYQHGLRHMGEVEHGRALVGLGGMTS